MSFNGNVRLIEMIAKVLSSREHLIVFYTSNASSAAKRLNKMGIRVIQIQNGLRLVFRWLPVMMTGKLIFCDNYYPFLGGFILPRTVRIIQLWHANGAIKRFGWEDPRTPRRSRADRRRFRSVYNHFSQFVVASKAMGHVFVRSYHVPFCRMNLLGYPRSDQLRDPNWITETRQRVYQKLPDLKGRRVILYAPTYRKGITFRPPKGLGQTLCADPKAIVLVKLHPLLRTASRSLKLQWAKFPQIRFPDHLSTMALLTVTETLITDYSSVVFDYSLLPNARSVLFFMFDLARYQLTPGCQEGMKRWLPTRPLLTLKQLANAIVADHKDNLTSFNRFWNTYNDGHATWRLIDYYFK